MNIFEVKGIVYFLLLEVYLFFASFSWKYTMLTYVVKQLVFLLESWWGRFFHFNTNFHWTSQWLNHFIINSKWCTNIIFHSNGERSYYINGALSGSILRMMVSQLPILWMYLLRWYVNSFNLLIHDFLSLLFINININTITSFIMRLIKLIKKYYA
jgi:hypothetical protein